MTALEIIVIIAASLIVVGVAALSIRNKIKGKSSCGCDCAHCGHCSGSATSEKSDKSK